MAEGVGKDMSLTGSVAMKQLSLKGESIMKKWIVSQPSSWPALSESYKSRKQREGKSTKALIRTSSMLQSIKGYTQQRAALIGIKRNATNEDGEVLANIALIHEYGSEARNIPARPFMDPTYRHLIREIQQNGLMVKFLKARLARKYGLKL